MKNSLTKPLISLASGIHDGHPPDVSPRDMVWIAAEAGFNSVGLWVEPGNNWHSTTTKDVASALHQTGLQTLDVEVIWLQPDAKPDPNHHRIIDIGNELGALNCLVVSSEPDRDNTKRLYEDLCTRAEAGNIRVCLEYMWITEVKTLDHALDVVTSVNHPLGGILIDPFHHERVGHTPEKIREVPPKWLSYVQLCDMPKRGVIKDEADYLTDALDGRLCPGEGILPLEEYVAVLPASLPVSLEIRSRHYRETYTDALARAVAIKHASDQFFRRL